jgi:hypothetical protein
MIDILNSRRALSFLSFPWRRLSFHSAQTLTLTCALLALSAALKLVTVRALLCLSNIKKISEFGIFMLALLGIVDCSASFISEPPPMLPITQISSLGLDYRITNVGLKDPLCPIAVVIQNIVRIILV